MVYHKKNRQKVARVGGRDVLWNVCQKYAAETSNVRRPRQGLTKRIHLGFVSVPCRRQNFLMFANLKRSLKRITNAKITLRDCKYRKAGANETFQKF